MLSHTRIKCKNRGAAAIFHGPGPPHPSRARRFCPNSHKPLANRAVSAYNASRINFFPRRIFHECESKKQLHRLHRLCPGRRRKRCGRRQYLAVSLPCRQGRGRRVPACLSGAGADLRLLPADHRRGHRQKNPDRRPPCLRRRGAPVEILGPHDVFGARHHHDLLFRHRRLDLKIRSGLSDRRRGRRRGGRVFHWLHHLQSRPCVLYAHFPGGHRLHRLSGGWRRASKSFPGSSCRGCCFWSSASRSTP